MSMPVQLKNHKEERNSLEISFFDPDKHLSLRYNTIELGASYHRRTRCSGASADSKKHAVEYSNDQEFNFLITNSILILV